MNENTLNIILFIVTIVVGGLTTYFKTSANLKEKTSQYITDAENQYSNLTNVGNLKFEMVVDKLYSIVPIYLKPFITRAFISSLVQQTFNSIQAYAKTQLDKCLNPTNIEHEDGK